jgi:hypothetical protein
MQWLMNLPELLRDVGNVNGRGSSQLVRLQGAKAV